jgi:hypothetical protein
MPRAQSHSDSDRGAYHHEEQGIFRFGCVTSNLGEGLRRRNAKSGNGGRGPWALVAWDGARRTERPSRVVRLVYSAVAVVAVAVAVPAAAIDHWHFAQYRAAVLSRRADRYRSGSPQPLSSCQILRLRRLRPLSELSSTPRNSSPRSLSSPPRQRWGVCTLSWLRLLGEHECAAEA